MKITAKELLELLVTNTDEKIIEQKILGFAVSFADPVVREGAELSDFADGVMRLTPKLESCYMHIFNLIRWRWEDICPAQKIALINFVDKKIDATNDLGAIQSMADFLERCK